MHGMEVLPCPGIATEGKKSVQSGVQTIMAKSMVHGEARQGLVNLRTISSFKVRIVAVPASRSCRSNAAPAMGLPVERMLVQSLVFRKDVQQ